MESEAVFALFESIKLINKSLEKLVSRIEILENDYKERSVKKQVFKWLFTFYPFVILMLILMLDLDHQRISEIANDVSNVVKDAQSLTLLAENEN